jgi:hypothetical protein
LIHDSKKRRDAPDARHACAAPPYRSHDRPPSPSDLARDAEQLHADIAFTVAFIWATALLRFVIVCRRHEVFTADPLFAALLTFGIPAAVVGFALVAMARGWRDALRLLVAPS